MRNTLTSSLCLLMLTVGTVGCASAPISAAGVAHYATDIREGLRATVQAVGDLNKAKTLPDAVTLKILDKLEAANKEADKLVPLLRAYDAATGASKAQSASDVSAVIASVTALVGEAFSNAVPPNVVAQLNLLQANVTKTILAVQLEIAKVKSA